MCLRVVGSSLGRTIVVHRHVAGRRGHHEHLYRSARTISASGQRVHHPRMMSGSAVAPLNPCGVSGALSSARQGEHREALARELESFGPTCSSWRGSSRCRARGVGRLAAGYRWCRGFARSASNASKPSLAAARGSSRRTGRAVVDRERRSAGGRAAHRCTRRSRYGGMSRPSSAGFRCASSMNAVAFI